MLIMLLIILNIGISYQNKYQVNKSVIIERCWNLSTLMPLQMKTNLFP